MYVHCAFEQSEVRLYHEQPATSLQTRRDATAGALKRLNRNEFQHVPPLIETRAHTSSEGRFLDGSVINADAVLHNSIAIYVVRRRARITIKINNDVRNTLSKSDKQTQAVKGVASLVEVRRPVFVCRHRSLTSIFNIRLIEKEIYSARSRSLG